MLKISFYIILIVVLVFVVRDVVMLNQNLTKKYKTDERKIYLRYSEENVRKYVDESKNWKIKFQAVILVITMFISLGYAVFIEIKWGFPKIYLFFQSVGIVSLYNAWSLHEDHIFISNYLKSDPENILNLYILDELIYNKSLIVFFRSGILLMVLPMLFPMI
ncbi:hypothetical protein WKK_00095 [Weissella koreensis KACC 15510]|uniref:hypothetical protein n=1 Tax=Weissella koreensis TaxID=165096 RepID=UPI00021756DA|nr:hypothetical protein [Weissella koreensis]AEJ22895.1 hypothetical protein WKK_00095 [Weissella koreensis KACC 15510]